MSARQESADRLWHVLSVPQGRLPGLRSRRREASRFKVGDCLASLPLQRTVDTADGDYRLWDEETALELHEVIEEVQAEHRRRLTRQPLKEAFPTTNEPFLAGYGVEKDEAPPKLPRTLDGAIRALEDETEMAISQIRELRTNGRPPVEQRPLRNLLDDALVNLLKRDFSAELLGQAIGVSRVSVTKRATLRGWRPPQKEYPVVERRETPSPCSTPPTSLWAYDQQERWLRGYGEHDKRHKVSDWAPARAPAYPGRAGPTPRSIAAKVRFDDPDSP